MSEQRIGSIKAYYDGRGFGFIQTGDNCEEFFHVSECRGFTPKVGLKVKFEPGKDRRGRSKAFNITCEQSGRIENEHSK